MSIQLLSQFLPQHTFPHLQKWFGSHQIHIHITRDRNSKLGDYRKLPDKSHKITLNSTLEPELFFFVLTHELAHLLAFHQYGFRIPPHGTEWKMVFRNMHLESLDVYCTELKQILIRFSKSPKANFMASEELVRYFHRDQGNEHQTFVENLDQGETFVYRKKTYEYQKKLKKNYLCKELNSGKTYLFKALVQVEKQRLHDDKQ